MKVKEKVMIFALYDNEELNKSYDKEQALRNYCKGKKYDVVEIYREAQLWSEDYSLRSIIDILNRKRLNSNSKNENNFSKVVVYNIYEICGNENVLATVNTLLGSIGVEIESIVQGVIGKDLTYKVSLRKDDYIKIMEENNKYLVKGEPF